MSWGTARSVEQIIQQSQGIADGRYMPPLIEKVRIINVNIDDWSVDCVSEYANKRFFDIQVMSSYFHYAGGEGIYVMPEVGSLAWLCKPSSGRFAPEFILGFAAPFDEDNVNYRAGRQNLNPGDIMLRTRDENFIILRRGGVIQIGATPTAQRIYVPIQNVIRDFAENYQLFTFGGELTWETDRDDQTTDGSAPTKFSLKAKSKANESQHIAELTIGSHGEGSSTTLELTVWTDGSESREARAQLQISNEGDVTWNLEKDWTTDVTGKYSVSSGDDMSLETSGSFQANAQGDASLESVVGNLTLAAGQKADMTASVVATIDAPLVKHGGGAISPIAKGTELMLLINAIVTAIDLVAEGPLKPLKGVRIAATPLMPPVLSAKNLVE